MSLSCPAESIELPAARMTARDISALRAFAHVAYGFDAKRWQQNWRANKVVGLNEEFPYGYHHAAQYGASVTYSTDHAEGKVTKFLRLGLRGVLGFDLIHAWRNRREMQAADVVWTHTESQTLAVLMLFALTGRSRRPKVLGQAVWLMDEWPRLSVVRKAIFKWLLRQTDILSFLSPLNAAAASKLFPKTRIEFVKFGINTSYKALPRPAFENRKTRVLAVGNDRHRDWATLIAATKDAGDTEVRIISSAFKPRETYDNVTVLQVRSNEELFEHFAWADMLLLTLKPNLHASGITVLEEAAILGLPAICTRVGGLDAYFPDGDVLYIDAFDPEQARAAVRRLAEDPGLRIRMIENAARRLSEGEISSRDYARRHVELSREICPR